MLFFAALTAISALTAAGVALGFDNDHEEF